LQGLFLDDQVVVAGAARERDQVDRDRRRRRAVVGGGEFVDDGGHTRRGVLRRLRVFGCFSRD